MNRYDEMSHYDDIEPADPDSCITYRDGWATDRDVYVREQQITILPVTPELRSQLRDSGYEHILDDVAIVTTRHTDEGRVLVNHPDPEARAAAIWAHIDQWSANALIATLKGEVDDTDQPATS